MGSFPQSLVSIFVDKTPVFYKACCRGQLWQEPSDSSIDFEDMIVAGCKGHGENYPSLGLPMKIPVLLSSDVTRPRNKEFVWGLWGGKFLST